MRSQRTEYGLGVLGKRTFQFAYFAIVGPPEQVIAPETLALIQQRQNMFEQGQGFRCDSGGIAQRLIQTQTSLELLFEPQTGCLGRKPDHVSKFVLRWRPEIEFSARLGELDQLREFLIPRVEVTPQRRQDKNPAALNQTGEPGDVFLANLL